MKKSLLLVTAASILGVVAAVSGAVVSNVPEVKAENVERAADANDANTDTMYYCSVELYNYYHQFSTMAEQRSGFPYEYGATDVHFGVETFTTATMWKTEGAGFNLADENGKLPALTEIPGSWGPSYLAALSYALWCRPDWQDTNSQYLWAGEEPYCADSDGSKRGTTYWTGDCTYCATTQYMKYWMNYNNGGKAAFHPGDGCAVAVYFVAPTAGTIYIRDDLSTPGYVEGSSTQDGVYMCAYKVPAAQFARYDTLGCQMNNQRTHGIFDSAPIYPTAGVTPTADYTAGWKKCGASCEVITPSITVAAGDAICLIYSGGLSINNDLTIFNPRVIYGTSPVDYASDFYSSLKSGAEPICSETGDTEASKLNPVWAAQSTVFSGLTDDAKDVLKKATTSSAQSELAQFAGLYDHIYTKYNSSSGYVIDNFASRTVSASPNHNILGTENNTALIATATIIAVAAATSIAVVVIKKRKEN